MKKNKQQIIDYINSLDGYQGYIQYSDRRIENIWETNSKISCDPQDGFVYEAHFYNGTDSIAIRQINGDWFVDEVKNVPLDNTEIYQAINELKVRMAQIWEEEEDKYCEGMKVKKLKKVVFAGFVKGEKR